MSMKSTLPSVNLLNFQRRDFGSQFIDWALTIGRLLIIITETVAFGMFVYRFTIDYKLVDTHDYITQHQPYLVAEAPREVIFRDVQDRLQTVKQHQNDTATAQERIAHLVSLAQGLVVFQDVKVVGATVKLDAQTNSVSNTRLFIDKLRADSSTRSLTVEKVGNNPSTNSISLSLTITEKTAL